MTAIRTILILRWISSFTVFLMFFLYIISNFYIEFLYRSRFYTEARRCQRAIKITLRRPSSLIQDTHRQELPLQGRQYTEQNQVLRLSGQHLSYQA